MTLIIIAGLICLLGEITCQQMTADTYYKISFNDNVRRPVSDYLYRTFARSQVECSKLCTDDDTCMSFFFSKRAATDNCQLHDSLVFAAALTSNTEMLSDTGYYAVMPSGGPACPTGSEWVTHVLPDNSVFYLKIIANGTVDWQTAVNYCSEFGANLAKISTVEKMSYFLNNVVTCSYTGSYNYHVDGTNLASASDWWAADAWKFHDGTQVPMIQGSLWAIGRPNNPDTEHCLWISQIHSYYIDDCSCTLSQYSSTMCELIA